MHPFYRYGILAILIGCSTPDLPVLYYTQAQLIMFLQKGSPKRLRPRSSLELYLSSGMKIAQSGEQGIIPDYKCCQNRSVIGCGERFALTRRQFVQEMVGRSILSVCPKTVPLRPLVNLDPCGAALQDGAQMPPKVTWFAISFRRPLVAQKYVDLSPSMRNACRLARMTADEPLSDSWN